MAQHSPCPAPTVEPYDGPDANAAAVAAATAHSGKGAALRARRVFAAALPSLGLWGAAAALRHALSREEPYSAAAGDEIRVDEAAAELVARPQILQSAAGSWYGAAAAGAEYCHYAAADGLADAVEAAIAQALPLGEQNAQHPENADHSDECYEPLLRRAGRAIDAAIRAAPPATLLSLASAAERGCVGDALSTPWISDKVAALLRVLLRHVDAPPGWRCVVFCERRDTARALEALLRALAAAPASPWAFLRPGAQTGYAAASAAAAQRAVLSAFRAGVCNCVFATSVLEEGVDVPECALVVLFDLARNVKSFIQARGRARAATSRLAVLVPRAGGDHARLLARVAAVESEMHAAAIHRAASLAASGDDASADDDDVTVSGDGPVEYVVLATGARVALSAAVALIHQYTAKLPHDRYCENWRPDFALQPCFSGGYTCTLTLPAHVWLPPVASGPQQSKRIAHAAAALAAVAALHAGRALTDHLVPSTREPDAVPAAVAVVIQDRVIEDDAEADVAALRCGAKEPDVLAAMPHAGSLGGDATAGTLLGEWHLAELVPHGSQAEAEAHPVRPCRLGLLTRQPLPPLPPLRLRARNRPADCRCVALGVMTLSDAGFEAALRRFLAWTHAAWFERNPGVGLFSPLAAPLAPSGADLNWSMLCAAEAVWNAPCDPQPDNVARFAGCVVWTRHTGAPRAFYALSHRDDVTADTLLGDDGDATTTLGEYFERRHGVARSTLLVAPWLSALPAPTVPRNALPPARSTTGRAAAAAVAAAPLASPVPLLLPAALCSFGAVGENNGRCPAQLWRALSALPAQLWRLRGLLLAQELAQRLLPCGGDDMAFVAALAEATTAAAAGEDMNLERLELLGDAFLKYAVSVALFTAAPRAHEGQLSTARSARVCNAALAAAARNADLHRFLRASRFAAGASPPPPPPLGRKALADALEAVVGATLATRGPAAASAVAATLRVVPAATPPPQPLVHSEMTIPRACDDVALAALTRLEAQLLYVFAGGVPCRARAGRLALLDEALTHASSPASCNEGAPAYQRLEFLGDAAIDLLATRALFAAAGSAMSAGALTAARSAAVCNERLAGRAAALGLARHLRHGSTALHRDMLAFVAPPTAERCAPPPKVLADVLEAVVGAVLLDSGMDLEATWRVAAPMLALDDAALRGARSSVAALFEAAAAAHVRCALVVAAGSSEANNIAGSRPMQTGQRARCEAVCVHVVLNGDVVVARGSGGSRAEARRRAAKEALAAWPSALEAARGADARRC